MIASIEYTTTVTLRYEVEVDTTDEEEVFEDFKSREMSLDIDIDNIESDIIDDLADWSCGRFKLDNVWVLPD